MKTPWGDGDSSYNDDADDEGVDDEGVDTCHHGVPFDEDCDRCEGEDDDESDDDDDFEEDDDPHGVFEEE